MFQITEGTMNIGHVVLLGVGIVFIGLICIVILCVLMGKVVQLLEKGTASQAEAAPAPVAPVTAPAAAPAAAIPNRPELVAAIACALAEEMGTDVSAIRICSLKKV